jgi:hypothetical protein
VIRIEKYQILLILNDLNIINNIKVHIAFYFIQQFSLIPLFLYHHKFLFQLHPSRFLHLILNLSKNVIVVDAFDGVRSDSRYLMFGFGRKKSPNVVADVLEQVRLQCVSIACRFLYDGGSASMHDCVTRDVVSDIDSLCQGALGEQVVYR